MIMTAASKLLDWYQKNGRRLPWRKTRNPYEILVSEIMLQQTQVDRVIPFYITWLQLFPDWQTLAKASNTDVIHAWAGLGYNRRALVLRNIAMNVVEHGVPKSEEVWRQIKGIGPYTAAAVSAFAQKKRTLPIDTNIRRVVGRLLLGKPFPTIDDDEDVQRTADTFLPKKGMYYDVPQAIFDLASMICKKKPLCVSCPLKENCRARKTFLINKTQTKNLTKTKHEKKHLNKKHPDRIYRGRILKCLREHRQININDLGSLVDPTFKKTSDQKWLLAMVERLVKDNLVKKTGNKLTL